jgi:hypothetical protein
MPGKSKQKHKNLPSKKTDFRVLLSPEIEGELLIPQPQDTYFMEIKI